MSAFVHLSGDIQFSGLSEGGIIPTPPKDLKTTAQRGEATTSRSHSRYIARFKPSSV